MATAHATDRTRLPGSSPEPAGAKRARPGAKTLLVLSQVFVPDPASVGQHVADVAFEFARRGYRVRVVTSACGYENPAVRYKRGETLHGADIRRLPFASFGKKSLLLRILGTLAFQVQAFFAALFTPDVDAIFFSTSPPLIGVTACLAGILRRIPVAYWAMDLNPDQLIALGKLKPTDALARFLESVNRFILRQSAIIVALDRFMAARLRPRGYPGQLDRKMLVMPPWPHENHIEPVDQRANPFRQRHDLEGKFVVMYSGNHSPSNPLATLLQAAVQLRDEKDLRFVFVGGGIGKKEVEQTIRQHGLTNAVSLPYQPLADLRYSLTAGDVHVVSLGEGMVGIIHPCKVYGAMAAGRPILFFGPRPSHISDLLEEHAIGWHVHHGDTPAAVRAIDAARRLPRPELDAIGARAADLLAARLSQDVLCTNMCDAVEGALFGPRT